MRVIQVVNSLALGGAEVFLAQLAITLIKRCDVQLWTYAGCLDAAGAQLREDLENAGVSVRSLDIRSRKTKALIPLIWRHWIQTQKPDIIHAHLDQSELLIAAATVNMRGRPLLMRTLHSTRRTASAVRPFQRLLTSHYDYTVACSEAVLRSPFHRLRSCSSAMIPCGTLLPRNPLVPCRVELKCQLGLPLDKAVLLCIGTMGRRCNQLVKGQDRILREFALSGLMSRAVIVFLGDGSEKQSLVHLAAELGISSSVFFCGTVLPAKKWEYVMACDGGLVLSRFEGLPIAGMEFACSGVPMLLSDIPELTPFANRGSVVAATGELAAAMCDFVNRLPLLRSQSAQMLGYYRELYSIDSCAAAYHRLYSEQIRDKRERAQGLYAAALS